MIQKKIKAIFEEKGFLNQSAMVFFASFFGSIALFASSILLARIFGPADFANFKIATNLFILLPSLIEFGIGVTLVKYIAEFNVSQHDKIPSLIKYFLKIRAISFAIMICALFVFRKEISGIFFHSPELAYLVIGGLWISGFLFFEIFKQIALGFSEFKQFSQSQFLTLFLCGILSLFLGYFFGVFYSLLGWGVAYLFGNINVFLLAQKKTHNLPEKEFSPKKILFSFSLPMYSLIIPNLLGTALVPLAAIFFEKTIVGHFAFAIIFFNGAGLVPIAFNSTLLPKLSEAAEKKINTKKILFDSMKQYSLAILPLSVLTIVLTWPVLNIIAPAYAISSNLTIVLAITGLLIGYFSFLASYFTVTEQIKFNWISTIVKNVFLLIVSFLALAFL